MQVLSKYTIKPTDTVSNDDIIRILLKNRGITDTKSFLNSPSPLEINLEDFGFKKELKKTLQILETIKKDNGMIVVYTDYDADGITGGAIVWETLHLLGFKAMPYVPHRKHEGYGFSIKGIDNVKKQYNPSLIISVDHGITAREKISYAKSLGIPVIVTDHHVKPEKIPEDAEAIFHIPELSGSGVAYFFAKAIYKELRIKNQELRIKIENNFSSDYLALSSIGTIADLVPLVGSSRSIAKYGLDAFEHTKRVGLRNIMQESGIEGKKITPYEIGFIIAPRINAIGRLEHAIDALRLLCTTNHTRARELANKVGGKNKERQDLVKKTLEEAKKMVSALKKIPNIIALVSSDWHEGIIGLIAAKIADEFYRPVLVMTQSDGFLKGSARSIPSFHITDFLRELKTYLIDAGGHKQAAGFTLEKEKLDAFLKKVEREGKKRIREKDLIRMIEADLRIPLSKVTMGLVKKIETLAPFGIGNPHPVFYSSGKVLDIRSMGKNNEHIKLIMKDDTSFPMEFVCFNAEEPIKNLQKNQEIDVVYRVEINRWNGSEKIVGKLLTASL